jgi:hypothetical protein
VAAILVVVVNVLVRLPLTLRLGNATATVAMMRMVARILAVTFRNSFVASIGHVPLLLLAAVVVVTAGHGVPLAALLGDFLRTRSRGLALDPLCLLPGRSHASFLRHDNSLGLQ